MDLSVYQRLAAVTDDRVPHGMDGLRVLLLGVVGEAGSAASEAKKSYRDVEDPHSQEEAPAWVADLICEELGDMLWYMAAVARRLGRDFDTIAADNLEKTSELCRRDLPPPADYDDGFPEEQSLARRFAVLFDEDTSRSVPVVRMRPHDDELRDRIAAFRERKPSTLGTDQIGDTIDDNAHDDIGYRFHDVLHLAHAAVLGWSPVFRSLTGSKRKSPGDAGADCLDDAGDVGAADRGLGLAYSGSDQAM